MTPAMFVPMMSSAPGSTKSPILGPVLFVVAIARAGCVTSAQLCDAARTTWWETCPPGDYEDPPGAAVCEENLRKANDPDGSRRCVLECGLEAYEQEGCSGFWSPSALACDEECGVPGRENFAGILYERLD